MSIHIANNKVLRVIFAPLIWMTKLLGRYCPTLLVRIRYYVRFHKRLNLKNPQTLNEKILYLSLKTDTTEWTRLADKYAVREYVKECGLEDILVKLYAHWTTEDEVDFDELPNSFVIKSVQGSGDVIIVKDKSQMNEYVVRKSIHKMLTECYGALEGGKHYLRIKPAVVVEELLPMDNGVSLIDYKIWCFNGMPYFIWVCRNRTDKNVAVMTYDTRWNAHPEYSCFNKEYKQDDIIPAPINLERMLDISAQLAKTHPVVRLDLYNIKGQIYFGEMSFTSLGGLMDFYTDAFQYKTGKLIDLSYKG